MTKSPISLPTGVTVPSFVLPFFPLPIHQEQAPLPWLPEPVSTWPIPVTVTSPGIVPGEIPSEIPSYTAR